MTAARMALLVGLICTFAMVIWVSGNILTLERTDKLHGWIFSIGLRGLWTVQAMAIAFLAHWLSDRFGWRQAMSGLLILILVPLPLLTLSWLTGAVQLAVLGYGLVSLLVGSILILGAAEAISQLIEAPFPKKIGIATVQILSATAAFALIDTWFAWVGL